MRSTRPQTKGAQRSSPSDRNDENPFDENLSRRQSSSTRTQRNGRQDIDSRRDRNSSNAEQLTLADFKPYPSLEGATFHTFKQVFSEQTRFPPNIRFAPSSTFLQKCIFGPGTTFGTGCIFRDTCIFGQMCVFDSYTKFHMPCLFMCGCSFGHECMTAKNSYFQPGCQYVDQTNSISVIDENREVKEDLVSKLSDDPRCRICKHNNKSHILLPCRHLAVCKKCKDKIKRSCPVCHTPVQKILEVK